MHWMTKAMMLLNKVGERSAPVVLLLLRLLVGSAFVLTGVGKLRNLQATGEFFGSLGIPLPQVNALMAGSVEALGGVLLVLGLASRAASVPLIGTMVVALLTAHREGLLGVLSDPGGFLGEAPVPFLMVSLVVFAFGAGPLSLDRWIGGKRGK